MEFPYEPRDVQSEIIKDIEKALEEKRNFVFEAPTGTGKTVAVLYPVVKYAQKYGKRVVYLVRTNSQETQVIKEARKLGVKAIAIQGRSNLCPLARENKELSEGNAEELSLLCRKLKKECVEGGEGCPYFRNFLESSDKMREYIEEVHTAEEIYREGVRLGICPYESIKSAMKDAFITVAPYIYFFEPFIRRSFLENIGTSMDNIILIVDEAHNLPDFARELKSLELSIHSLERMEKESLEYGNPMVLGYSLADIAEYIKEAIYLLQEFVGEEDGLIPEYIFEEKLSKLLNIKFSNLRVLSSELVKYGEMIREDRAKRRKLPRSYVYHTGAFLYSWMESYSSEYLKLIKWDDNPTLEIFCMDPAILTDVLRNTHMSIHMSGTLSLKEYRDVVSLPQDTILKKYPSPFPKRNLKIFYVEDVTTKYNEVDKHITQFAEYLESIISLGRNTAVFFPSYSLMEKVKKKISMEHFSEKRGIKQTVLFSILERFRNEGGTIFSVFGGRISEGIDFPGRQLEIVVIVGIPYPKPTAKLRAMERYHKAKFGKGWEYVFRMPALIKMRQAIGRLIRGPEDRGVAVILDRRVSQFKEIEAERSENIIQDIKKFFENE